MPPDERRSSETFMLPAALPPIGRQEGEPWRLEDGNDPVSAPRADCNPQGNERDETQDIDDPEGGDASVRIADILDRFSEGTRISLKEGVRQDYKRAFRRFASDVGLERFNRRQLAGPRGKKLVLQHLEGIPRPSHRWTLQAIKHVWIYGVDVPWPITKRDVGRLPKSQRGRSPPDADIRPWADAAGYEKDPYLKLMVLFLLQFGLRPSHVSHLKWRNIEYDSSGRPCAIAASGRDEDFKTDSDVRAWLPPDVVEAVVTWKAASADTTPERPILPRKGTTARRSRHEVHDRDSFSDLLKAFERKWGLKHLSPKSFRHWVASKLREAGLSYQASAYWQGHDPTGSGYMRDWYDNRPEDIFAEQSVKLPRGPVGMLGASDVSVSEGLPTAMLEAVREYRDGKLSDFELIARLTTIRRKTPDVVVTS
jgi:integrase